MKSLMSKISVAAIAVAFVTVSFVADANGEYLYFGTRAYTGDMSYVDAYDLSTGNPVSGWSYSGKPTRQAIPAYHDGALYVGGGKTGDIEKYNALTGELIGHFVTVPNVKGRGLGADSNGNIYLSSDPGGVAKISPSGTINAGWGYSAGMPQLDVVIRGNKLYNGSVDGIWSCDFPGGGAVTKLPGTEGARADGLAFSSDDTLYTVACLYEPTELSKWTYDGSAWSQESIFTFGTEDADYKYPMDIEYYNGSLYVSCINYEDDPVHPIGAVLKFDDLDGTPTMSVLVAAASERVAGNLAIGPGVIVPEPSALALLAAGLFGLAAYAWKKRK